MRYTDEEKPKKKILAPGHAKFEILTAQEAISKSSGNPMMVVNALVFDEKGDCEEINDYFPCNLGWKIRLLKESVKAPGYFPSGELHANSLKGMHGECIIKTEENVFEEKTYYKTVIEKYLPCDAKTAENNIAAHKESESVQFDSDEDIPF